MPNRRAAHGEDSGSQKPCVRYDICGRTSVRRRIGQLVGKAFCCCQCGSRWRKFTPADRTVDRQQAANQRPTCLSTNIALAGNGAKGHYSFNLPIPPNSMKATRIRSSRSSTQLPAATVLRSILRCRCPRRALAYFCRKA